MTQETAFRFACCCLFGEAVSNSLINNRFIVEIPLVVFPGGTIVPVSFQGFFLRFVMFKFSLQ